MLIMLGMIFAQAMPSVDSTDYYTIGSLQIQRNLIVKQAGFVSSSTGAALEKYESIVTIIVKNNAGSAKKGVRVREDLSYVPPQAKFSFNIEPQMNANYATWNLGDIKSGEDAHIRFSVPAIISQGAFEKLGAPQVSFEKPKAAITISSDAVVGSSITISIKGQNGAGIANAFIEVHYPDGQTKPVQTDSFGNVRIIAQQLGTYSFSSSDYEVGAQKSISISARGAQVEPQPGQPQQMQPQTGGFDIAQAISDWWMIILVPIAVILAYLAYRFLSAPADDGDDMPIPPAPATRPSIRAEGFKQGEMEIGARDESIGVEQQKSIDETLAGMGRQGQKDGPDEQPGQITMPPHVDTRGLLSSRRVAAPKIGNEEADKEQEGEDGPEDEPAQAENARWEDEETSGPQEENEEESAPIAHGDEEEYKRKMRGKSHDYDESGYDDSQIDEEAIKKTIAELEQLRDELKTKSEKDEEGQEDDEGDSGEGLDKEGHGNEPQSAWQEQEPQEDEGKELAPLHSIVRSAKKSEREKVIDEDIGKLLDEEEDEPTVGKPKKRGLSRIVDAPRQKKRGPGRPPKAPAAKSNALAAKKARVKKPLSARMKMPKKGGPGRPPKASAAKKAQVKASSRGPGRPPKKRGPGRPKKK
ncbi:MAG: hypothetical protein V1822_00665 [Candidatus Micrarchaeota archaeon]